MIQNFDFFSLINYKPFFIINSYDDWKKNFFQKFVSDWKKFLIINKVYNYPSQS